MGLFKILDTVEAVLSIPVMVIDTVDAIEKKKKTNAYIDLLIDRIHDLERNTQLAIVNLLGGYAMEKYGDGVLGESERLILDDLFEDISDELSSFYEVRKICEKLVHLPVKFKHVYKVIISLNCSEKEIIRMTKFIIKIARSDGEFSKEERNFIYKWKRDFNLNF